jgi:hypothetical protein
MQLLAVNMAVGPTIRLQSGASFDFLDPTSSTFTIEDIAHGLSNICRYSGQCRSFYSVAEHSIVVSHVAKGFELAALMHDAAEAFVGDVTRPLKQLLPEYKRIEQSVQRAILIRFGLPEVIPPEVKDADLRVLAAEQAHMMPPGTDAWARPGGIEPASIAIEHMPPKHACEMFLRRFEELR